MSNRKEQPGDLIKIPINKNLNAFARMLIEDSYAVYDFFADDQFKDFKEVINHDILFTAHVNIYGVKKGYWKIVGNFPLENNLKSYYPKYFNPAPMNIENVNIYRLYESEIEDAISKDWVKTNKWQLDGTHDNINLEERIFDYYNGKRHSDNSNAIWWFKKYLGLPIQEYLIPEKLKVD